MWCYVIIFQCYHIIKVQSLHLGHVAKSFGLKESPKTIRVNDDTIGKIFNGTNNKILILSPRSMFFYHMKYLFSFFFSISKIVNGIVSVSVLLVHPPTQTITIRTTSFSFIHAFTPSLPHSLIHSYYILTDRPISN